MTKSEKITSKTTKKTTKKQEKSYNFITDSVRGYAKISTKQGFKSAQCPYPMFTDVVDENTGKVNRVKMTKKQVEEYLLSTLGL